MTPSGWARSLVCSLTLFAGGAAAQSVRWIVDPRTSLAWWQVDPHYNHLWATTCPNDPSWQPGEGRDAGWTVDYRNRPELRDAGVPASRIPLFPRKTARPLCAQAVHGEVVVADAVSWNHARGAVVVDLDSLVTGYRLRDQFARRAVLETARYPTIRFTLDSLTGVEPGDTIRAIAVGTLELRGVRTPLAVPVKAWSEAGGLRVEGQFSMPAHDLVDSYAMSRWALGLGVVLKRWKTLHMGIDLVLVPATS